MPAPRDLALAPPLLLVVAGLWTPLAGAQDPVRVNATLDPSEIRVGDTAVIELTVHTDGSEPESIDVPSLPAGLNMAGTRNFSRFRFSLPGGRTREVRREITVLARRAGRFQIAPIRVVVDGTLHRSRSLSLTVAPAPSAAGGAAGEGDPEREVLLRARIAPETAYVGQQVTVGADAFFSERAQNRLRSAPEYEPPSATGFWVHDLPDPPRESQVVDGRRYEVRGFRRAYFPLRPGEYTLPPARLIYDMRRGFLYTADRRELASDSLHLVVRPLPEAGRPASFTGAVGRYTVEARLEPGSVPAGEAAVLVLVVRGRGNLKALPAPPAPELEGVRFYPPGEDAETRTEGGRVVGRKRFSWVVVPEREGELRVPPIEYAFFEPDAAEYRVARTDPLTLRVRPGAVRAEAAEEEDAGAGIRYLKMRPGGSSRIGWVRSRAFAALQLLPLLVLGALVWYGHRQAEPTRPSKWALRRRRRRALAELRGRVDADDRQFFSELEALVRRELADRLSAPALRGAQPGELERALRSLEVDAEVAGGASRLLVRLDRASYEPRPPGREARALYLQVAERTLDAVDGAVPRPSRLRQTSAAALLAVLLSAGAAGWAVAGQGGDAGASQAERALGQGDGRVHMEAADTATDPAAGFRSGSAAYASGEHRRAASAFAAFVRQHPDDAHGWYNLGSAHYRTGRIDRAIWAWLHALRLAPRDGDIRHNLQVAEASPALVRRVAPWPPLSDDELLLAASAAWLIGAVAFVAFLRSRRRAGAVTGLAGAVLASLLVGSWSAGRLGTEAAVVLSDSPVRLHAAPIVRARSVRRLEPGAGVEVTERRDDWSRVRTLDAGREGWLETDHVGMLR